MDNKLLLPIAIIIAGILIAGTIIFVNTSSDKLEGTLTSEEATTKVISFINDSVLQGGETAESVETLEENGVYKIKFSVNGEEVEWSVSRDGKLLFPQVIDIEEFISGNEEKPLTVGDFSVTGNELCSEDGKPIVYFFGSETCPHCQWEHPVMQKVATQFNDYISFHDNMDSDADSEIFAEYNKEGYIPLTLIGCQYSRVGSGETAGEEVNIANLTALICKVTGGQPGEVCDSVLELINTI